MSRKVCLKQHYLRYLFFHTCSVYCPYPGTIENGIILLVGVIGKYEYRSYVKRTEHNQEIQYHCSKQFKRIGPAAATCVDGQWSPRQLPKCVPEQHPKLLYLFRGKRSINGATEAEAGDRIVLYGKQEWSKDKGLFTFQVIEK